MNIVEKKILHDFRKTNNLFERDLVYEGFKECRIQNCFEIIPIDL